MSNLRCGGSAGSAAGGGAEGAADCGGTEGAAGVGGGGAAAGCVDSSGKSFCPVQLRKLNGVSLQ